MIETTLKLISAYGFPIVMCTWFMVRTEKVIVNNTKALNTNSTILSEMIKRL